LHTDDLETANAVIVDLKKAAQRSLNPAFMQVYHQHAGMIALHRKNYGEAIGELEKSDMRSPRTLFLMGEAYAAKGDAVKAKEFYTKAANFNEINIEFAYVRAKAKQLLGKLP
jgi:predicted negative regulator of RcsB-dependent stress response